MTVLAKMYDARLVLIPTQRHLYCKIQVWFFLSPGRLSLSRAHAVFCRSFISLVLNVYYLSSGRDGHMVSDQRSCVRNPEHSKNIHVIKINL
ncbi:hypothetical protein HOLleu_42601 [Holothuria leucospilota]|uniref:Uncharacterized protein n=1 Tax=Holothuria leucospilota TaxID=206669 RepID=A0A9Q1B9A1_HOLLE|nr:hypothetical protein HOLleu_42601 [Holothuria leucospilota]